MHNAIIKITIYLVYLETQLLHYAFITRPTVHLFSRISRISAGRENIFSEILGATPSLRSAPTWVWSGFGLIAKIFFAKFAPVSNLRKYRSAKTPAIRYYLVLIQSFYCVVNLTQTSGHIVIP